jgi:hypothetical protein
VSHQPERKEKNCLNCGATVAGRYCQVCGQENSVSQMSIWALARHFVYDIFHFDGKFFETLRYLLFKPGFVPREYISGKRERYLEPVRMYLFTSALFFLILFSLTHTDIIKISGGSIMTRTDRLILASRMYAQNRRLDDSILHKKMDYLLDTSYMIVLKDTVGNQRSDSSFLIDYDGKNYFMEPRQVTIKEINTGNSWFSRKIKALRFNYEKKYGNDYESMFKDISNSFIHKVPHILFISLHFFALILMLLYVRRKNYYYSDHAIFTLYHYIFTFIMLLFFFLINEINGNINSALLQILAIIFFIMPGIYLFIAMKKFYAQGFGKTLLKYIILNVLAFVILMLLMLVFILLSVFQI